jgi:hypothetical protein
MDDKPKNSKRVRERRMAKRRIKLTKKQKKINQLVLDELQYGYHTEKRIHPGWREQKKIKKFYKDLKKKTGFIPSNIFGKWQYLYHSEKGDISLIKINITTFNKRKPYRGVWEMWSNEKIFQDVIRFETKKQAEKKIKEYLCQ